VQYLISNLLICQYFHFHSFVLSLFQNKTPSLSLSLDIGIIYIELQSLWLSRCQRICKFLFKKYIYYAKISVLLIKIKMACKRLSCLHQALSARSLLWALFNCLWRIFLQFFFCLDFNSGKNRFWIHHFLTCLQPSPLCISLEIKEQNKLIIKPKKNVRTKMK
jgi:hypothetical protein